jgi:hypothetical protein
MPEISATKLLRASADSVWATLADFGNIQRWWPRDVPMPLERVTLEGQGIGMIRHILNRGARQPVSERLDLLDSATRTIVLSIVGERPIGLTAYVAEGRVVEIDPEQCRLDYRALFTTMPGREEVVRQGLLKTWSVMFRGLEQACGLRS